MTRFFTRAILSLVLTGCSGTLHSLIAPAAGSGPSPTLQPSPQPSLQPSLPPTAQSVTVHIDAAQPSSTAHRPKYVSPATTQLTIDIERSGASIAGYPKTVALTPTSNGCTIAAGVTQCTLTLALNPNGYTLTLTAKDSNNVALSAAQSIPFTVAANGANNVNVTLGGIPASVKVVPNTGSLLVSNGAGGYTLGNCLGTQSVSVFGVDADGYTIVAPGAPSVALTSSNPNALSVTAQGTSAPNAFTLMCAADAPWNNTVSLSASVTPATGGATVQSPAVPVTFHNNIAGNFTLFSSGLPAGSQPAAIAPGPDGALWFTEASQNIGRVTPAETISGFPATAQPGFSITAGPDSALWYTVSSGSEIGRITTNGVSTSFSSGITGSTQGIALGPDGALWFTEPTANRIGRITTNGNVTEYSNGIVSNFAPSAITAGPDGALWFTGAGSSDVGRITTTGTVTEFPSGVPGGTSAGAIASGPDGALWFAGEAGSAPGGTTMYTEIIGRITTTGTVTQYPTEVSTLPTTVNITAGPDGNMWFTDSNKNVGRITTNGSFIIYPVTGASAIWGITAGSDGHIWFTDTNGNQIGEIQ